MQVILVPISIIAICIIPPMLDGVKFRDLFDLGGDEDADQR
ncbi:hypothetical protein [Lacticaseibacillus mingshuiensis]|uniref:Uncharacterized protein n=1 Tax=Lacticaseibacillus mingshuiensis TaxID=2799574 RepID=A0ABW4CJK8_9LACO|nr:hypothetical protein [Lacticaseibacillus mingshuiensis]